MYGGRYLKDKDGRWAKEVEGPTTKKNKKSASGKNNKSNKKDGSPTNKRSRTDEIINKQKETSKNKTENVATNTSREETSVSTSKTNRTRNKKTNAKTNKSQSTNKKDVKKDNQKSKKRNAFDDLKAIDVEDMPIVEVKNTDRIVPSSKSLEDRLLEIEEADTAAMKKHGKKMSAKERRVMEQKLQEMEEEKIEYDRKNKIIGFTILFCSLAAIAAYITAAVMIPSLRPMSLMDAFVDWVIETILNLCITEPTNTTAWYIFEETFGRLVKLFFRNA